MDKSKEQISEMVREELKLLEGQQAFIAYAHLRAYDENNLNEGLEDIFSFFKQAVGFGLDTVTDVVKNKAASFILDYLNIPKGSVLNIAISNGLEQLSMEDWKKILAGDAKCPLIAGKMIDGAMETVIELIHKEVVAAIDKVLNKGLGAAESLLGKTPNPKAQAVSAVAGVVKKLPTSMKLAAGGPPIIGQLAGLAASSLGSEIGQNAIRELPIVKKIRQQATKYVCDAVDSFTSGNFKLPDLTKYVDK